MNKERLKTFGVFAFALLIAASCGANIWIIRDEQTRAYEATHVGGMRRYVDPQTGCEYLSGASGSLNPRVDATGKQLGCK